MQKPRASTYILFIAIGIAALFTSYLEYFFINPIRWMQVMGSIILAFFYFVGMLTFLVWFREKTTLSYRWGMGAWNLMLAIVGTFIRLGGDIFAAIYNFIF